MIRNCLQMYCLSLKFNKKLRYSSLQSEYFQFNFERDKKGFTHFQEGDVGIAKITPCFENINLLFSEI